MIMVNKLAVLIVNMYTPHLQYVFNFNEAVVIKYVNKNNY